MVSTTTLFCSKMSSMMERWLSVSQAAKQWEKSAVYIRKMVRNGRIKGQKVGNTWVVDEDSIKEFMASERKVGRKPKAA